MANILGFAGIGVSGFVLLFSILAISLNYWQSVEIGSAKSNIGLWESCTEILGTKTCVDINSDSVTDDVLKNYRTVRAMVILGILLSTGAIVARVLVMFVMRSAKMLYFVAAGLAIAAGFFLMIGMAVYVDKIKNDNFDLHAAFALDIIAWLAAWAAGGIYAGAKIMDKE